MLAIALLSSAFAAVAIESTPTHAAAPCRPATLDTTDRLQFNDLDNASGMVASKVNQGVFWTHNDKDATGAAPNTLFAIDASGNLLATVNFVLDAGDDTVPGDFVDLEDIAMGPGPVLNEDYLHLADIGDNSVLRSEVAVYRFLEPQFDPDPQEPKVLDVAEAEMEAQRFTYQQWKDPAKTEPRNAEAIFVDPEGGDLYIFEKGTHTLNQLTGQGDDTEFIYSNVYRIPRPKLFFGDVLRTATIVGHVQHLYDGSGGGWRQDHRRRHLIRWQDHRAPQQAEELLLVSGTGSDHPERVRR